MMSPPAAAQPMQPQQVRPGVQARTRAEAPGSSLAGWRPAQTCVRLTLAALLGSCLASAALAQTRAPASGQTAPSGMTARNAPAVPAGLFNPSPATLSAAAVPTATPSLQQRQQRHERELQAIRRALLETTLQGPTRVMSAAWIDASGTLRELAHFNSESRVEGVRVLGYVVDEEDTEPVVSAEVLPWAWPRPNSTSCQQPPRSWRLPLQMHSQLQAGISGPQQWIARTLLQGASEQWLQRLETLPRWQVQSAPPPTPSTYEQALSGTGQGSSGWGLTLSLGPAPEQAWQALGPLEHHQRRGHWAFRLTLQMQEHSGSTVAAGAQGLQMSQDFWVDPQSLTGPGARREAEALLSRLQSRLDHWAERLQAHFDCEPMRYTVQHEGARKLVLQAGQGSGLRPGDRVLVLDPARIPSQLLEPNALAHLALAEVVRVNRHQTELQQLAGPALPAASTWVALPL